MEWIPISAWIAAVVVAVVVLGFCGYEIRWKVRRLQGDLHEMQGLAAELTRLQGGIETARQRLAATGSADERTVRDGSGPMVSPVRLLRRHPRVPEGRMPVMDHLRELRRRVIIVLLLVALGAVLGYYLYPQTLSFLRQPFCNIPLKYRYHPNGVQSCDLIYHAPLDGFTTRLKVAVISGAVFTGPLWLYQIWAFITPGLHRKERKYTLAFVAASTVLFAAGVTLAYLVLLRGLPILAEQAGSGTQAQLTVSDYISFVTLALVAFGAAFELPLIVVMANFVGVLPAKLLKKSQRIAIFLIFLFAAIATPSTDPFTMCAMAVPMVLLFEVAVFIAVVHDRRKARRKAAERAESHLEDDVASSIDPIPERLPAGSAEANWSDTT